MQAFDGIRVTFFTTRGTTILRLPGLPSTLPVLRGPAAATAASLAPLLDAFAPYPWRTMAVAPLPSLLPWTAILAVTTSGTDLPFGRAGLLKLLASTAALFGHLLRATRLARLNDALVTQAQVHDPWIVAEDDRIVAGTPEGWRIVEAQWRRENLDLKADYARLPFNLLSTVGLDLPIQLPGATTARVALTTADFLPQLITVSFARAGQPGLDLEKLTDTERKILGLILTGMGNRGIADHCGRSVLTVQNHVHSILDKLQAGDRRELLVRAGRSAPPQPGKLERFDIGPPLRRALKKPVS